MTFNTLVFSAGNMHGLMFLGVMRALERSGVGADVRRCVGCSAGAIAALAWSIGCSSEELLTLVSGHLCVTGIPRPSLMQCMNIMSSKGLMDGTFKRRIVRDLLRSKLGVDDVSFADLAKRTGVELIVVGTSLTTSSCIAFGVDTAPRMSVTKAIDISTCVPIMFVPIEHDGHLFLDGAVYNHLPTDFVPPQDRRSTLAFCIERSKRSTASNLLQMVWIMCEGFGKLRMQDNLGLCNSTCILKPPDIPSNKFSFNPFGGPICLEQSSVDMLVAAGETTAEDFIAKTGADLVVT
jgi:NTE family protein